MLSKFARDLFAAGTYDRLVVTGDSPVEPRQRLDGITPDKLFNMPIKSLGHAHSALAGLWHWLDGLAECQEIAQMEPHGKARNPSQLVQSAQSVEGDNNASQQQLAQAADTFAFWTQGPQPEPETATNLPTAVGPAGR